MAVVEAVKEPVAEEVQAVSLRQTAMWQPARISKLKRPADGEDCGPSKREKSRRPRRRITMQRGRRGMTQLAFEFCTLSLPR